MGKLLSTPPIRSAAPLASVYLSVDISRTSDKRKGDNSSAEEGSTETPPGCRSNLLGCFISFKRWTKDPAFGSQQVAVRRGEREKSEPGSPSRRVVIASESARSIEPEAPISGLSGRTDKNVVPRSGPATNSSREIKERKDEVMICPIDPQSDKAIANNTTQQEIHSLCREARLLIRKGDLSSARRLLEKGLGEKRAAWRFEVSWPPSPCEWMTW